MAKATNNTGASKTNSTTSVGAALKAAGAQQALPATKPAAPAPSMPTVDKAPAKPAHLTRDQRKALSPEALASWKQARDAYRAWRKAARPSVAVRLARDISRISKILTKRAALFDAAKVGETDVRTALANAAQWLDTAGVGLKALGPNWKPSTKAGAREAAKSLDAGSFVTLTERGAKEAAGFLATGVLRIKRVIDNKALVVDSEGSAVVLALKHLVPCDAPAAKTETPAAQ